MYIKGFQMNKKVNALLNLLKNKNSILNGNGYKNIKEEIITR